jgi:hypothetical protein
VEEQAPLGLAYLGLEARQPALHILLVELGGRSMELGPQVRHLGVVGQVHLDVAAVAAVTVVVWEGIHLLAAAVTAALPLILTERTTMQRSIQDLISALLWVRG